jgi:hypothetical protein
MSLGLDLVEFDVCDIPGAPGFLEALYTLAGVLERRIPPFPRFVEYV